MDLFTELGRSVYLKVDLDAITRSVAILRSCCTKKSTVSITRRMDLFTELGRSVYLKVDLDAITRSVAILRSCCTKKSTGVIGVVKGGAYGHGSVHVSRHLKSIGVERLAVATTDEGIHLRKHDISGPIHILGNLGAREMEDCLRYALTPTVCCDEAISGMSAALHHSHSQLFQDVGSSEINDLLPVGAVHIEIDTGMSRYGCEPQDLPRLIKKCDELGVPLEGIYTHFADSCTNESFSRQQLQCFLQAVEPFRSRKLSLHVANSGAIINGLGTDLDFIRPGETMYGFPPGTNADYPVCTGIRPAASIKGVPTQVKRLPAGRMVGYSCTYTTEKPEWTATFPVGYADGYWGQLSSGETSIAFVIRDKTGEKCPVVGQVSMGAITVKLPCQLSPGETFTLMSCDFDDDTSATGIANTVGAVRSDVLTRLSMRYPRVYHSGPNTTIVKALTSENH